MKRFAFTSLVLLFAVFFSFAQSRTDLKGPAAKNYKPWMNKEKSDKTYVVKEKQELKGPAAKNQKVWSEENQNAPVLAINMDSKPSTLKGPEAKNRKVWQENRTSNVQLAKSDD